MGDAIDNWRALNPQEFHPAEGIDALKQQLGDIRESTSHFTTEHVVADQIYNAVRQTIVHQLPDCALVMKGYESACADTALRKQQSTLRDNVNSSFVRRAELANYLVNAGAPNLMEKLAG
jgi:hypothetical protein